MTENTNQITADNLRADFLNATTNWQRWKVLDQALEWAVAASENAHHYRQQAAAKNVTVNLTADDMRHTFDDALAKALQQALNLQSRLNVDKERGA